jgi:hypothetical protein
MLALVGLAPACGLPDPDPIVFPPPPPGPRTTGAIGRKVAVPITCPLKPPDPSRTRVMVVDRGFDLRHPIFAGKIAGCYEIECPPAAPFDATIAETDDERAARYIAYLRDPGPDCTLKEGLVLEVDSYLEEFDPKARAEWNETFLSKRGFDESWDLDTLIDATGSGDYHGTASAGAIAYQNDVDIVAVQIKLDTLGDVADTLACPSQASLDRETRMLSRPDVAAAYVGAPLENEERILMDLRRRHGVRIENHSFGPISNRMLERLLGARCPPFSLEPYTLVQTELDAQRLSSLRASGAYEGTDVLTFQSSGNYGDRIDDGGDTMACLPRRELELLVGAYELYREQAFITDFSNYGECVDAYALGSAVLLPTANAFYGPFWGTSFSAPLAARYASSLARGTPSAASLRDQVFAARDAGRFLPVSTMPAELSFYSLTPVPPIGMQHLAPRPFESPQRFERQRRSSRW